MEQDDAIDSGPSSGVGGGNANSSGSMGVEGAVGQVETFLSDIVLSWTMDDVHNNNLYKNKVTNIPALFNSIDQYQETHSALLVEETRAMLSSAIRNVTKSQVFHLDSVQGCGSSCYYIDINLDKAASNEAECHHVAKDNDIFLLSHQSPLNLYFDMSSSCLGMAIKIGQDTFYQKNFTLLLSDSRLTEVKPEEMKFATFLSSLTMKMKISEVLSSHEKSLAITTILNIHKMIDRRCAICNKSTKLKTDSQTINSIVSSVTCVHRSQTQIISTPPGTGKHQLITAIVNALVARKLRILICFPSTAQISEFLTEVDNHSNVLVLNNDQSLKKHKSFHKLTLDHKSQQLFCCFSVWNAWLTEMALLLRLDAYYHIECQSPDECERCIRTGLLVFSLVSFTDRVDNVIVFLENNLKYIREELPKVWIPVCDLETAKDLLATLGRFKDLMNSDSLTENIVQTAFGLVAGSDLSNEDDDYTIGKELDETRLECINFIDLLNNSLKLPRPESRQEMEHCCMKHSLVIVSTPDCTSQLYGVKMDPFHAFVVGDAGQVNENELLIPFGLPLKHTVLLGDHQHLQPLVESQICEAAGYKTSLFQRLEPFSKKNMLREQHQIHSSISQFPNEHFYEGKIVNGPKVNDVTYSEEFKQLNLHHYAFLNIQAVDRGRFKGEITIQSAAIMMQIDMLHRVFMGTRLKIAVICLSRDEADTVRRQLRPIHKMCAKFNLDVKSIDSLEPEWYDMVILSTIIADNSELEVIKDNNINAALTCSRHICWIIGEATDLLSGPAVWRKLAIDARKRKCMIACKGKSISEFAQCLELQDESKSIHSNPSHPNTVLCKPGQEITWVQRPHMGKYILAHVRDQRGQPDTCVFQSCAGSAESGKSYQCACLVPPEDFRCILSIQDYSSQYVNRLELSKGIGSEDTENRGKDRMGTALDILKDPGVLCSDITETEIIMSRTEKLLSGQRLKISTYASIKPEDMDTTELTSILKGGKIMPIHFRLSRNFFYLSPGEVYRYDETMPIIHPKSNLPVSHAVMMIGIGHEHEQSEKSISISRARMGLRRPRCVITWSCRTARARSSGSMVLAGLT